MEIICPFCEYGWDEPEPKANQVTSYQCLHCGTSWSVEIEPETTSSTVNIISVGDLEDWERLEASDPIVYKF